MFCAMHGLVTIFAPTEPFLMYDSVALGGDGGIEVDLVVSELKRAYTLVVCISDILFCQLILWQRQRA